MAATDPTAGSASAPANLSGTLGHKLALGFYIACWYAANIGFNIVNKTLMKSFPLFVSVTAVQMLAGATISLLLWGSRMHRFQRATLADLRKIYPLALAHLLGNLFTNFSLRQMAVSFTHVVKASEPFFSVVLAKMFIPGTTFSWPIYASLMPIVFGVVIASVSEVSFNWPGFLTAVASNVSFQSRNVLSKKFMKGVEFDDVNLFGWISCLAAATALPLALIADYTKYAGVWSSASASIGGLSLLGMLAFCGLLHYLYNQFSYVVLHRVSPVTHSIGNTVKRVAVIVSSVLFFRNPVSRQNIIGTIIALAGVAIYSQVKTLRGDKKKAA
jgi:solute carrier family 35 protein E1